MSTRTDEQIEAEAQKARDRLKSITYISFNSIIGKWHLCSEIHYGRVGPYFNTKEEAIKWQGGAV